MPSGHGVDKPRKEEHPNRQVGPHLREKWTGSATSGPMGTVSAQVLPSGSPNFHGDMGITMASWAGKHGHHAEVEQSYRMSGEGPYSGVQNNRYVAGPFRTQMRSQIAAEALANRVRMDDSSVEKYESDSSTEYTGRRY